MFVSRNKSPLLVVLALLFSLTAMALVSQEPASNDDATALPQLVPQIQHARTAEEILIKLQRRHYEKRPFNDQLSSSLLDAYLENLDPNKSYFTAADIARFEQYRFILDDGIRRGNLQPSFSMFQRYREVAINYLDTLLANLPETIAGLNFERNEDIVIDADTLDWPANAKARDDRMRKSLINSVLSLRLSDKDDAAILETLQKRFKNQRNRLKQLNAEDVFQVYMNSLVSLYDPHSNYMSPRTSENFSINMSL
ncbi:MAG: hypothetical protein HKO07_00760 [Pseudomonadales bacterium]|nr:hypothetical protein [Pseudomonadales bacterium]